MAFEETAALAFEAPDDEEKRVPRMEWLSSIEALLLFFSLSRMSSSSSEKRSVCCRILVSLSRMEPRRKALC